MSLEERAGLLLPATVERLAEIARARLEGSADRTIDSVSIDTRSLNPGALFVALPGTNTDGHAFLNAAYEAGAVAALVAEARLSEVSVPRGLSLLVVDDPLAALGALASVALRNAPGIVRIGITGSNGKTTTKELVATVLGTEKRVFKTRGNFNSVIGIPLSVFAIPKDAEVAVFEMAMNQIGEMAALASIVRPEIAIITNIGTAHIGMIGSQDGIAREKKEITSAFTGSETLLVPARERYRDFLSDGVRGRVLPYGAGGDHGVADFRDRGLSGIGVEFRGEQAVVPLVGLQNTRAIEAALAIAELLLVDDKNTSRGLSEVRLPEGRGKVIPGSVTIIEDCYNASPESTAAALRFLSGLDWPGRKVAVLGDMLELGEKSPNLHRGLQDALSRQGRAAGGSRVDAVFTLGREMSLLRVALDRGETPPAGAAFVNTKELEMALGRYLRDGDLVLLKGSRGMALERLVFPIQSGAGVSGGSR